LSVLAPRAVVLQWCAHASVDPSVRPEMLAVEDFAALQRARESDHA
jgi:hypothetical protein